MTDIHSLFPVFEIKTVSSSANQVIFLGKRPDPAIYDRIKSETNSDKIFRLAVFLTHKNQLVLAAPCGPDMNTDLEDLEFCVKTGIQIIENLGIRPAVGIISGGRKGDLGRNETVDKTILDAEALQLKLEKEGINSKHYTILIEDAVKEANFLILPDSLSGEMILKTIAGVGEGQEIGNILLLKPARKSNTKTAAVGLPAEQPIYIEQLTKKADTEDAEILKKALVPSIS